MSVGPEGLGAVAIGRNEGQRLHRCLESLSSLESRVVYVDSGSTDDSIFIARSLGVPVVELDMHTPFTAARARNAGFQRLMELHPDLRHVFFVDGDCEVVPGWLDVAGSFLTEHADVAIVWGNRRERFPQKSVYNMLCDIEWWDHPIGEAKACGGDALIRITALRQVNGYRPDLICGEEPEMCVRLRQIGWRIWHLDAEMTLHDAAIYRFGQWWKRMLRAGYSFAQAATLHGAPPELHGVVESRRAWIWGLAIPSLFLGLAVLIKWWSLSLLLFYPLQVIRIAIRGRRSRRDNWWRAASLVFSKFPEMLGQVKYFVDRLRHAQSRLIEYK